MTIVEPFRPRARRELPCRLAQIGGAVRLSSASSSANTRKIRLLPRAGDDLGPAAAERDDRHPIEVREPDVAERRGDPPRHVELRRLGHRAADVDQDVDGEVLLLLEQAEQQLVEPAVGSSRCSGSRRRGRTCGDRRTRCPSPPCGVRRSARFFPANTLRETMCRCSSVFRNRLVERPERSSAGSVAPVAASSSDRATTTPLRSPCRISAMIASVCTPSASPSKLRIRRWRSAGARRRGCRRSTTA